MRPEALERLTVQHLPVVGMRDADHQLGALLQALAVEVHGAVLGHDPVSVRAGRDHAGARVELRDDLVLPFEGA